MFKYSYPLLKTFCLSCLLYLHGCATVDKTPEDYFRTEYSLAQKQIDSGNAMIVKGDQLEIKGENMIKMGKLKQQSVRERMTVKYGEEKTIEIMKSWGVSVEPLPANTGNTIEQKI